MIKNIFQQQVTPEKPKVLAEERIYVYLPTAGENKKGIASFKSKDFVAPNGEVSLRWPMDMMVQQLADPTARPSLIKVLPDEFVHTNIVTKLIHPITGIEYSSALAEVKLNRENRNALAKPELVMLSNDFEAQQVIGPNNEQYNSYRIKRQNPLTTPTIIQVDDKDFIRQTDIVKVSWPYAHNPGSGNTGSYGLVKVTPGTASNLKFDAQNNLQVDIAALRSKLNTKPTYGESDLGKWPTRANFIDPVTGLAKRDVDGNILLSFTKEAIGLNLVENRTLASRTYNEFGAAMKAHFESQFDGKLNKSFWDGPNGLFRDWAPAATNKNTVQRWLTALEEEDTSIWASLNSLKLFLGFYPTLADLQAAHPANEDLEGSNAFLNSTDTYWAIRLNGETWEWFDTELASLNFYEFLETDPDNLKPNAPVASVSVGTSGKWIQSDHVHPSDPTKIDAKPMEDAFIQITTMAPSSGDFSVKLLAVKVVDDEGTEIVASIVDNEAYLASIVDPEVSDKAITRDSKKIYNYDGSDWVYTGLIGGILYDTVRTLNIPYVRTSQFFHNWKDSPYEFAQGPNSNEKYWAGSKAEFETLDLENFGSSLLVVTDDEDYEPGEFVTRERLDEHGITLSDVEQPSTDQFAIIDRTSALFGVPLTITTEPAIPGIRNERRKLEALDFGSPIANPTDHRMAIVIPSENGDTLGKRIFVASKMMQSDENGNLAPTVIRPNNVLVTTLSNEDVELDSGKLLVSSGSRTVDTIDTGVYENRPIVANGTGGVKIRVLTPNRLVKTGDNGDLQSVPIIEGNIIKSDIGVNQVTLDSDQLILSGANNTIKTWNSGGVDGSLLVRGAANGSVKVRTHSNLGRLLVTAADGTLQELPAGETGQMLASAGVGSPAGWINAPSAYTHLPQTRLTSNPTEAEANAFQGLVAVVLQAPIPVDQMRNNCIYFY